MNTLSTQNLAYLGDAVFELQVRAMLTQAGSQPVYRLNHAAKGYVSATAQAAMYRKIFGHLTEEEQTIMKRGRNLHMSARTKHADMSAYRHATGLEVLFGYLHMSGRFERIEEIFALCAGSVSTAAADDLGEHE